MINFSGSLLQVYDNAMRIVNTVDNVRNYIIGKGPLLLHSTCIALITKNRISKCELYCDMRNTKLLPSYSALQCTML